MSKTTSEVRAKSLKAYKRVQPVMEPLLDLFAVSDDVFTEPEAFSPANIHKSLGRIYRSWLNARTQLDPEFDPARYRQLQKQTSTGTSKARASASRTPSTGRKSILGKSQKPSASKGKPSAKPSARAAKSGSRASNGR